MEDHNSVTIHALLCMQGFPEHWHLWHIREKSGTIHVSNFPESQYKRGIRGLSGTAQALLDEWRAEAARKPLGMTEGEACQVLEVTLAEDQELDDEMLKAAYRSAPDAYSGASASRA